MVRFLVVLYLISLILPIKGSSLYFPLAALTMPNMTNTKIAIPAAALKMEAIQYNRQEMPTKIPVKMAARIQTIKSKINKTKPWLLWKRQNLESLFATMGIKNKMPRYASQAIPLFCCASCSGDMGA